MKLSNMIKKTETLFDAHNGEIVCVTRVDDEKNMIYGKYCTGPYTKSDMEFRFCPNNDLSFSPKN